ncbi:hypothetical protein KSS87_015279 [Heliosperma pusillum]|nr:hypothetical protein KSS87_015279 [Heliosperma pusillum]
MSLLCFITHCLHCNSLNKSSSLHYPLLHCKSLCEQ